MKKFLSQLSLVVLLGLVLSYLIVLGTVAKADHPQYVSPTIVEQGVLELDKANRTMTFCAILGSVQVLQDQTGTIHMPIRCITLPIKEVKKRHVDCMLLFNEETQFKTILCGNEGRGA